MIDQPLALPCGAKLANRIAKGAMTEGIADAYDNPTARHETLYRRWSHGGAAVHVTGNVMLDRRYLERPGNVVLDDETDLEALARWATAGTEGGNHLWMQLNHPGRQAQKTTSTSPVSASDVGLDMAGLFGRPRALTVEEIEELFGRYRKCARRAKDAGFTGIQVHSAHGYLSNQFLSPVTNRRTDEYGGSLPNRARFLLNAVRAVRETVGDDFPVSVKLNSADFQKGGFSNEDAAGVAALLNEEKIDLLEISGGTYESLAFVDERITKSASTQKREAYFLEYAKLIREAAPDTPLMVTGGFRTRDVMVEALEAGELDVIGIARPFCFEPEFPIGLLDGSKPHLSSPERSLVLGTGMLGPGSGSRVVRTFNGQASVSWFYNQIELLADGKQPDVELGARKALATHLSRDTKKAFLRKRRGAYVP